MKPVWQTCPCCNARFLGSDIIGFPCFDCIKLGSELDPLGEWDPTEWVRTLNQVNYLSRGNYK